MREFTEAEKHIVLKKNGWDECVGYMMDFEPPEGEQVFISLEQIRDCIGKIPEMYWLSDSNPEYLRDTDDAWECLLEELQNVLDPAYDDVIIAHIERQLKEA